MSGHHNFQPKDALSFGPFSLSPAGTRLRRADAPIPLGGRALDVLIALTEQAGEVVSYRELRFPFPTGINHIASARLSQRRGMGDDTAISFSA
jgi:hypothetical protein